MKIAFVGGIFPKENIEEILKNSSGVVQSAADALQKSFLEGLGAYDLDVEIINLPFLGSYPKRYKKLFSPSNEFTVKSNYGNRNIIHGKNVRYFNLSLVKYDFIYRACKKTLLSWAEDNSNESKIIVVYSLFNSFLRSAIAVKNKFENTHIICIVPDLKQYTSAGGNSLMRRWYKKYNIRRGKKYIREIDGFIILGMYMADSLKIGSRPYEVIEGIYNNFDENLHANNRENVEQTVFYAGTLAKRYGVLRLVEAFSKIKNADAQLVICGEGDAKPTIEKNAQQDKRIKLLGNIPRTEVLSRIQSAHVLVNPRTPEGEFTKYSFPSKTMEYLASGTPTILYKLPGIPEEYYNHCVALSDLSIDALKNAIEQALSMNMIERESMGIRARTFILNEKNPEIQVKKLLNLINTICQSSKTRPC